MRTKTISVFQSATETYFCLTSLVSRCQFFVIVICLYRCSNCVSVDVGFQTNLFVAITLDLSRYIYVFIHLHIEVHV